MATIIPISVPVKAKRRTKAAVVEQASSSANKPALVGKPTAVSPAQLFARGERGSAPKHRYFPGQQLHMSGGGNISSRPSGPVTIKTLLPYDGVELRYRVKSDAEAFERIIEEAALSEH